MNVNNMLATVDRSCMLSWYLSRSSLLAANHNAKLRTVATAKEQHSDETDANARSNITVCYIAVYMTSHFEPEPFLHSFLSIFFRSLWCAWLSRWIVFCTW